MSITRKSASSAALSPRQLQVLQGVWDGHTNAQLAHTIGIDVKTVEFHWNSVKAKFALGNRMQVVRRALRQGLLKP